MNIPASLHLPLLLLAAAFLFVLNLGGYDLWPADEPRYAQVAREMMQSGDYLIPHVNGEVYLEKPPLLMWLQAAFSLPVGDVTETTARLPSVFSALIVILFTYLLARRLFDANTALWSALILMTIQRFWWQARTGQIDMLLTACMMAALYALWRWDQDRRTRWLIMLYAGVALGMLAKGPPALVFPIACIIAFYWRDPASRKQTRWVVGSLCALAATAAWYLPARLMSADSMAEGVQSGIGGNLFRNIIGRVFLGVSKAQPPWYYVAETIPLDLLPWTLLLPWVLVWVWRTRNQSAMHRFLWCWTVPALILFSLSIGKRAIYILPLFPVFAIWIAASLQQFEQASPVSKRVVRGILAALFAVMAVGLFVAPAVVDEPGLVVDLWFVWGPLLALAIMVFPARNAGGFAVPRRIVGAVCVLFTAGALHALPMVNQVKGASDFCKPLRELTEAGTDYRLYSIGFSRESYVYYTKQFHEPVLNDLVGRDQIPEEEFIETARLQIKARKLLSEAVERIEVADWDHITAEERAALEDAAWEALHENDLDLEKVEVFEAALQQEVTRFTDEFLGGGPAYMFVRQDDWPWLIAIHPALNGAVHLRDDSIGSRDVLLLANPEGAALLEHS